jgi:hypothetical protein
MGDVEPRRQIAAGKEGVGGRGGVGHSAPPVFR